MHRNIFPLVISGLLALLTITCHEDPSLSCEGTLKDKPLEQFKNCIYGRWELIKVSSSGIGNVFTTNTFIEFTRTDSIYWIDNNKVILDTAIEWKSKRDLQGNMIHSMDFGSSNIGVEAIRNDTLTLYTGSLDGSVFYLISN
jgi:hypothetical protein